MDPRTERTLAWVAAQKAALTVRGARFFSPPGSLAVIEVRSSEGLTPGAYWALFVYERATGDQTTASSWLELVKQSPSLRGGAPLGGGIDQHVTSPSGREAHVWDVLVLTKSGYIRRATERERSAVGGLSLVR